MEYIAATRGVDTTYVSQLTFSLKLFSLQNSPVWEITGAEFSKSEAHTAKGISIRFPRCTKFRDDKSWKEATDLPRLQASGTQKAVMAEQFVTFV